MSNEYILLTMVALCVIGSIVTSFSKREDEFVTLSIFVYLVGAIAFGYELMIYINIW